MPSILYKPWDIWKEYHLNPWDADIIKRVLRIKGETGISMEESRLLDYKKNNSYMSRKNSSIRVWLSILNNMKEE